MSTSSERPLSGDQAPDTNSQASAAESSAAESRAAEFGRPPVAETPAPRAAPRGRPAAAWTAVTLGVVLALALVVFIAQNTQRVQVSFLGFDGSVPLAVALLAAAVLGAGIVLLVGTIRVTQLKIAERRLRHER